jgi:hypothetical protein
MYLGGWVCGMTCSATERKAMRELVRRYTRDTMSEIVMEESAEGEEEDTHLRCLRGIPPDEQRRPARSRFLYQLRSILKTLSALSSFVIVVF